MFTPRHTNAANLPTDATDSTSVGPGNLGNTSTVTNFHSSTPLKERFMDYGNETTETAPKMISGNGGAGLKQGFDKHARPLMDTIDYIRSLRLEAEDFQMPRIVVVGDQSVGKSSCLEALSGIKLPRGDGIVTRTPLEINMRTRSTMWSCRIRYPVGENKEIDKIINYPSDVSDAVLRAQEEITSSPSEVTDTLIKLEVSSPYVPDLTLIDLPGIARNNPEIESSIKGMIRSFIKPDQTIIMVVFPASTDMDTVAAVQLAKEVDPGLDRTMAVVTKMDLIGEGSEQFVMNLLNSKKINLGLGIFGVKCRSQLDVDSDVPLDEACRKEKAFFESHSCFKTMGQGQFGIGNVGEKLAMQLTSKIKNHLPTLSQEVSIKLNAIKEKLNKLEQGPPEDNDEKKRQFLLIIYEYTTDVQKLCTGEISEFTKGLKLFAKWREDTTAFEKNILDITDEGLTASLLGPIVSDALEEARGKALPVATFINSYPVCENLIRLLLKKWEEPCNNYVHQMTNHASSVLRELASLRFDKYPNLATRIKEIVDEQVQVTIENVEADIKKLFKKEEFVWTQDSLFNKENDDVLEEDERVGVVMSAAGVNENLADDVRKIVAATIAYMNVAARRVNDNIPQTVFYHVLQVLSDQIKEYVLSLACDEEGLLDLFQEREDIAMLRKELIYLLDQWRNAEKKLAAL